MASNDHLKREPIIASAFKHIEGNPMSNISHSQQHSSNIQEGNVQQDSAPMQKLQYPYEYSNRASSVSQNKRSPDLHIIQAPVYYQQQAPASRQFSREADNGFYSHTPQHRQEYLHNNADDSPASPQTIEPQVHFAMFQPRFFSNLFDQSKRPFLAAPNMTSEEFLKRPVARHPQPYSFAPNHQHQPHAVAAIPSLDYRFEENRLAPIHIEDSHIEQEQQPQQVVRAPTPGSHIVQQQQSPVCLVGEKALLNISAAKRNVMEAVCPVGETPVPAAHAHFLHQHLPKYQSQPQHQYPQHFSSSSHAYYPQQQYAVEEESGHVNNRNSSSPFENDVQLVYYKPGSNAQQQVYPQQQQHYHQYQQGNSHQLQQYQQVSSPSSSSPQSPQYQQHVNNYNLQDAMATVPLSSKDEQNEGTWNKQEHELFLQGYQILGRNWGRISREFVKTRSRTQVASHAQKYFKKVERRKQRRFSPIPYKPKK